MVQEAAQRLWEAVRLLEVEGRGSRLASLQRQLVARRCRLAAAYGSVYAVGPKTGLSVHPACPITLQTANSRHTALHVNRRVCCSESPFGPSLSALWEACAKG